MKEAKSFFGGIPTGPDVERLTKSVAPDYGTLVEYPVIEEAIGSPAKSARFRTVVTAWRKRVLREANIDSRARAGVGIEFLPEGERLAERSKDYDRTVRRTKRTYIGVGLVQTEKLTAVERSKADTLRRLLHAQLETGLAGRKEIAQLKPTAVNPLRAS